MSEELDTGTEEMYPERSFTNERKVTFGYTRKKNMGKDASGQPRFESEEASIYITEAVPEDVSNVLAWANEVAEQFFSTMKVEVWSALDLDFTFDEEGHPEVDYVDVPVAHVSPGAPPPDPGLAGISPPSQVHFEIKADGPAVAQVGAYAPPPAFCKSCGNKEFYDNRAEGDQKILAMARLGPDWKCKSCDKGVFRPGSYDYNQIIKTR